MSEQPEPWYFSHLACPDDGGKLSVADGHVACACGYRRAIETPLDLRPHAPLPRTLTFELSSSAPADLAGCRVERPANPYAGPAALRDSSELFSAVAEVATKSASLLDLGCGPRDQAVPAEFLGLRYVGVDYSSGVADVRADAHALPFESGTFDLVLAYAVLEHLYNPFIAAAEVARVLRPGGVFFGTVSQGEPFHDSYFHHTSWAVLHLFHGAGLQVSRLWYSYDTLQSLATMGRYPKVGRVLIRSLDRFLDAAPVLAPNKHFKWSAREKEVDALHRGASICFVATKRSDSPSIRDGRETS